MRYSLRPIVLACISGCAWAVDGVVAPTDMTCDVSGFNLVGEAEERRINFEFFADPPVRGELSDVSAKSMACFYVAGWRSIPIEGDVLTSESSCFVRSGQASFSGPDVYNCQIINLKDPNTGGFVFENMDCANANMDRISIRADGSIVTGEFASVRGVESKTNYFIGRGQCQFKN
ncbi:MAG: hypothetical protein VXA12_08020 [Gammaproteobacteria bacterium]